MAVPWVLVKILAMGFPLILKCISLFGSGLLLCVSVSVACSCMVSFQYPVAGFMVIFVGVLCTVSVVVLVVPV